jgi:hypothetical protein
MAAPRRLIEPRRQPPLCRCRRLALSADEIERGALFRIQVAPECETHWPRLPMAVKVRVLLDQGWRCAVP